MSEKDDTNSSFGRAIGRLEGKVDVVVAEIGRIGRSVDDNKRELYNALNSINPRLDALEKDLTGLRSDIDHNIKPAVKGFTKALGVAGAAGAAFGLLINGLKTALGF